MSETTNPLAEIERAEAELFRIGVLARRLLAEYPDLAPYRVYPWRDLQHDALVLVIYAQDPENARAWAELLGAEVTVRTEPEKRGLIYRSMTARAEIDGVPVAVHHGDYATAPEGGVSR